MSGFMFGGSALTLDIGVVNNSGAAVVAGDLLQIEFASVNPAGPPVNLPEDGLNAVAPPAAGALNGWATNPADVGSGFMSVTGAVVAQTGHSIPDGETATIRVGGLAQVSVLGVCVAGDLLDISPGNSNLIISALNGGNLATATSPAIGLIRGVVMEAKAAAPLGVVAVWLRPFGGI